MSDISNQILDAVELLVDKKVGDAKYDKTIQATIISCVDEQTGKYKIKYQGNIFIAYSSDTSKTFNNGISVYVVVPENDFSKTKTIIGSVANKGQLSSSIITEDQRYEEIGIDCIIDNTNYQPIELTSNSLMLYQNTTPIIKDKSLKDILQEEFQLNINVGKSFLLRATFNTEIENALTDKEYGLKVYMFTGDKKEVANYIGKSLNIDEIKYEMLPTDKYDNYEYVSNKDGITIFVGDGVNDAPVLKRADIGISMGGVGVESAIEASDIVIMKDDLMKIVTTIDISSYTKKIIKENLVFSLSIKLLILILSLFGYANMFLAVFADTGVTLLTILNTLRIVRKFK